MRRTRSVRYFWIPVITLLLAGTPSHSRAGFPVPPELEHATDEEAARYLEIEGTRSLVEKLRVGRERTAQRLAFKRVLVDAMWTNLEARRKAGLNALDPVALPGNAKSGGARDWQMLICLGAVLGLAGFSLIRYSRSQRSLLSS